MAFGGGQQFSEARPNDRQMAPGSRSSAAHGMGTYPGMDPIARYYAMPGASPWPGDPGTPGQPYMPRPMPQPAFDQDLLGGRYSTQEALENNPAALAARRQGLERGFAGGELWGDGNYRNYLAKMAKRGNPADDRTSLHMQARNDQPMGGLMGNRGFGPGLLQQQRPMSPMMDNSN